MTPWQTDDGFVNVRTRVSLPTPTHSPPRTSSQSSKRSKRSNTPPRKGVIASRLLHGEKGSKRSSRNSMEEGLSILDPRRFTPTLHANLVSEILALRRDQEEKHRLLEGLEISLETSREEQETLQENLTNLTKEARLLKRQLALVEGGNSSAVGDLARERDEAVESVVDARKRLDAAQKKIRSQEDDSQRVHDLWAREKEEWEEEKRKLERRIHVAESRLKTVLEEVESFQASRSGIPQDEFGGQELDGEESGRENDAASVRTMSITNSIRFTFTGGLSSMLAGNSLADELNFDDTDDETDMDGGESILSSPRHKRNFSRDSIASKRHVRNCSIDSLKRTASIARGKLFISKPVLEVHEGEDDDDAQASTSAPALKPIYTDAGIQYSPPPSPQLEPETVLEQEPAWPHEGSSPLESSAAPESSPCPDSENEDEDEDEDEVVQEWKRFSGPEMMVSLKEMQRMVSSASQTVELPLSPPKTPTPLYTDSATSMDLSPEKMVTSSTQTGTSPPRLLTRSYYPLSVEIPSINIEPPKSLPTSPSEPLLPQHFKHFGCQVNLPSDVGLISTSSQTDAIQTDKRLALLPRHLQPSSITSRPASPYPPVEITTNNGVVSLANENRQRTTKSNMDMLSSPISFGEGDDDVHYDLDLEQMPTSSLASVATKGRHRLSGGSHSGLYSGSSDEMDEFGDADISDLEYRTALSAPRPPPALNRHPKRNISMKSAPSPDEFHFGMESATTAHTELYSSYSLGEKHFKPYVPTRNLDKPLPSLPSSPNGTSAHRDSRIRNRTPGIRGGRSSSHGQADPVIPPFPIPNRASSRKPSISIAIPSDGRESPLSGSWHRKDNLGGAPLRSQVRRVRSSNSLIRNDWYRRNSASPQQSPATEFPPSPGLPPMSPWEMEVPRFRDEGPPSRGHCSQLSNNTDITTNTEPQSQAGSQRAPGVVEAIAQTMVGEWMFKYMRRRKSFGVIDTTSKDENSNERHKRWVWLAPYERAILWSSKQPSSGSALMGKAGRKLIIQSVLDVKDDNPPPRGANTTVFNRSILILTPQRALKFTATTAERHYLWLTALSFLAHSSQPGTDMLSPHLLSAEQQQQQPLPNFNVPRAKPKRAGFKDTIRLAKRGRTQDKELSDVPLALTVPTTQMGGEGGFNYPETPSAAPIGHSREPSQDAAEPPMIPRFNGRNPAPSSAHDRKRSNTGGHIPPPLSFRGFSGPLSPASNHHSINSIADAGMMTAPSPDMFSPQGFANMTWASSPGGGSGMVAQPSNFFDAIGTVRMEAFISPMSFATSTESPIEDEELRYAARRRRSKESRRKPSRGRNRHHPDRMSRGRRGPYDPYGAQRAAGGDHVFLREDPFQEF